MKSSLSDSDSEPRGRLKLHLVLSTLRGLPRKQQGLGRQGQACWLREGLGLPGGQGKQVEGFVLWGLLQGNLGYGSARWDHLVSITSSELTYSSV